jgi:hypothetical protein
MAENKSCTREIVIGVIIGVIVVLLGTLIHGLWTWVSTIAVELYRFLISSVTIPIGVIAILAVLSLPTLIKMVKSFLPNKKVPKLRMYTEDIFDGMIWRWKLFEPNNVMELLCFCPDDQMELVPDPSSNIHSDLTSFHCGRCNRDWEPLVGTEDDIKKRITLEIDRKIRTGEWKEVVKRLEEEKNSH